jgi:hypothetical protein
LLVITECHKFVLKHLDRARYSSESSLDEHGKLDAALIDDFVFDFGPRMLQDASHLDFEPLVSNSEILWRSRPTSFCTYNEMNGCVTEFDGFKLFALVYGSARVWSTSLSTSSELVRTTNRELAAAAMIDGIVNGVDPDIAGLALVAKSL